MRPTNPLAGASRLPLTTKRANKDYYKGTRQAYIPGTNTRTGLPGKHLYWARAKFQLDDEKVRVYVAPSAEALEKTDLKPYVSSQIDARAYAKSLRSLPNIGRIPPFSPLPQSRPTLTEQYASSPQFDETLKKSPKQWNRYQKVSTRSHDFTNEYRALRPEHKEALIWQARREWWDASQRQVQAAAKAHERKESGEDL